MQSSNWAIATKSQPSLDPGDDSPLEFGRDHHLRRKIFTEQVFQHKARTNLYWLAWLLDRHTEQGQAVLDPMGGAGSILLATTKARPVLTGDVEPHWVRLQAENALRIRAQMLFWAPALVCRWDAGRLPLPDGAVPAIVTSPPYFDMFSNWNRKAGHQLDGAHVHPKHGLCYGDADRQIGNLHVYEDYLRTVRGVYRECRRVLRPEGALILVVGDRIKRKRRIPITADAEALCLASGFDLLARHERDVIPSQFRNIHAQQQGDDYPTIEVETALVFQKPSGRGPRVRRRFAVVQAPRPNSSPGRLLFDKALAYAQATADVVGILTKEGLVVVDQAKRGLGVGQGPSVIWCGDHRKARQRKDWAYEIVRDLAVKHGLATGDEIALHVSLRYARYLQQRLNTLGARATIPTARHNLGRKLKWYTDALNRLDRTET